MDFSILIAVPTKNSSKDLKFLIKSLDSQTFQNWKVLFIDGSNSLDEIIWLKDFCKNNEKYNIVGEDKSNGGIYGAMNQAFKIVNDIDWLIFWGSDDYAFSKNIIELISNHIKNNLENGSYFDLMIYKANYFCKEKNLMNRVSYFAEKESNYNSSRYKTQLFFGSSLPHQATIFSPKVRSRNLKYNLKFKLAADLEYFLKLSEFKDLNVKIYKTKIVSIGDNGVSSKKHLIRTYEVVTLYLKYFRFLFFVPFLFRYLRRILSLLKKK